MDSLVNYLRTAVFFIDEIIYNLIAKVYELIIYLANVDIFSDNPVVQELMNRIYVLLGIFMLFKVSFSIVKYVIDPNSFSDQSKGFGKLVTNVVVALILLVSVPSIFSFAFELQNKILSSNVIGNLILGSQTEEFNSLSSANDIRKMATDVQFTMFGAFFTINTDASTSGIPECKPNENGNGSTTNVLGSKDMAKSESCLKAFNAEMQKEGPIASRNITLTDFFKYEDDSGTIHDERNFHSLDSMLWWKKDGGAEYTINYTPIISTLAGGYLLLLLITFCIDIAVRAIKLCFLEMIAPIAVISYIDPEESIGKGKLHNWIKESLTTFGSLFLRLAVIFLALRLVQMITSEIMASGSGQIYYGGLEANPTMNIFVYVFLIIGVFMFAKKVPQMIESIFGFKGAGDLQLNPFKGTGGALLAAGGAFAGAGLSNAIALGAQGANIVNETRKAENGQRIDTFRRTLSGVNKDNWNNMSAAQKHKATLLGTKHGIGGFFGIGGGAVSAAARAAGKGETKGLSSVRENISGAVGGSRQARIDRDSRQQQSVGTRASSAVTSFAGIKNQYGGYGELDKSAKDLRERIQEADEYQRKAAARKSEEVGKIVDRYGDGIRSADLLSLNTSNYLKQAQEEVLKGYSSSLGISEEEFIRNNEEAIKTEAYKQYVDDIKDSSKTLSAADFARISELNADSASIREYEASLKKELKALEESMGKKEDKK